MYSGRNYELLRDAVDIHVHPAPDVFFERIVDDIEAARQALNVGMKAIVIKCHHAMTADRAYLVRRVVEGIEVFGGICLDLSVGGFNPRAVETALKFKEGSQTLCKIVWMPTHDALGHRKQNKLGDEGALTPYTNGRLITQVEEILKLVAENDVILATGHLLVEDTKWLIKDARRLGLRKIVVTHPFGHSVRMPIEDQKEAASAGAYIEHCFNSCTPMRMVTTPKEIAEAIKAVGAERCVMSSDLGQIWNPPPVEGMRQFARCMLAQGIASSDIDLMMKQTPAKLLGL